MRQRLAGLVVVALVLLAGLMIGATPADARQEEEEAPTPTLVLVERSPWVSDSEPVTLQVSTTGDLADTTIRVRIHPTLGDASDDHPYAGHHEPQRSSRRTRWPGWRRSAH